MLGSSKIMAFIPTADLEKARSFYVDKLGLKFLSLDQFALVLDANGTMVRAAKVQELKPAPFTILGWEVGDIEAMIETLQNKGIKFEHYGLPGQNQSGIWTTPGAMVAWFKDPEGNVLSITQFLKR